MKKYISSSITYSYQGSATDQFGNYLGEYELTTQADSIQKAKSNFQYQIRTKLNKIKNYKINIDETKIVEMNSNSNLSQQKQVVIKPRPRCFKCGRTLTDGGYCPACNDGYDD